MVLNVQATSPPVTLSPSDVTFPSQLVGTTGAVQAVTFQNNAAVSVNISSVTIQGANASDFIIVSDGCSGTTLPPGSNCTIQIVFAPTATGLRTGQLVVEDNATGSPRITLLRGTGLPPAPAVCLNNPGTVSFGNVSVGATGAVQSVTITNCGVANMFITNLVISGSASNEYFIGSDTCSGNTIPPGGTCTFEVSFAPATGGVRLATLRINDDAEVGPSTITLTGNGVSSQPDAAIGKTIKEKKMAGNNVVNSTGVGQEFTQKVKRGAKRGARFFMQLKNVGTNPDQFKVEGDGDSGGFTVSYFLGAADQTDISAAVESGAHASATLAPAATTGDATMIRIEVFADPLLVSKGEIETFTISFTSVSNPARVDVVKATVIAK
jgi:hypothetical protein